MDPPGQLFGELQIKSRSEDPNEDQAILKACYDAFSRMRMPDIVETLVLDKSHWDDSSAVAAFNRREAAGPRLKSYKRYIASAVQDHCAFIFQELKKTRSVEFADSVSKFLARTFEEEWFATLFPAMNIHVRITAAIRQIGQRFRPGDIFDHAHAGAALPYCKAFFTERILANLLTNSLVNLDRRYGCTVLWEPKDVKAYLESRLTQ